MENTMPMITTKVLEITILVNRDELSSGLYIPHVAIIEICHDGSIFMKEYIDDVRRSHEDNYISYGTYRNWKEFKSFDTPLFHPAQMIEDWANKDDINLKWCGVSDEHGI